MFIKFLRIFNDNGEIRNIEFHPGLNLIVDNTPSSSTETGNNVGKTTVLRLIDFCLGKNAKVIYTDPANTKDEHKEVKDFLFDTNVIIELALTNDFTKEDVVIRRNFKKRSEAIREINGIQCREDDFEKELESAILGIRTEKPSFRQIISHNIRYSDQSINNVLKTLNPYTSDAEYETLYLFMFGCQYEEGEVRQEKIEKLKSEVNFKLKLEKAHDKSTYKSLLGLVDAKINELNANKSSLNINPNFESDLEKLNKVKYDINSLTSKLNILNIRKEMIIEAQEAAINLKSEIDLEQLALIYKQAKALIPTLQKTFNDLVTYHNQMVKNKIIFITSELPTLEADIKDLRRRLKELLEKEDSLTKKVVKSDTYDDLETIINELNEKFQQKGEYENIISQIEMVENSISEIQADLRRIDENQFSESFKDGVQKKIDKFNLFFSSISKRLYNEEYAIKVEQIPYKKTNSYIYKFSSFNANLSSGKKMGEISCFDIAYTMFADDMNIPCVHFLLNDKKELMSDNQLIDIAKVVEEENIQFVASILKDKLPEQLQDNSLFIIELSQESKLFKIEN